jgi:hypothetical protein
MVDRGVIPARRFVTLLLFVPARFSDFQHEDEHESV